jgi:hypothetical protein
LAIKRGIDLKSPPPFVPLPRLDDALPPQVRVMIAALVQHQAALSSPDIRTVVLQLHGSCRVGVKITLDIAS